MSQSFLAFLGISILVIVTPGPDTAMTIRGTLLGGRIGGLMTALGVAIGQILWALATSVGLVAILLASEMVFHAIKLAGAAYLVYLGVKSLLAALHDRGGFAPRLAGKRPSLAPFAAFRQGLVSDLGNPKMAVFFASVLPQFAEPGVGMFSALALLGFVFALLTFTWLAFYSVMLSALGALFQRPRIRRSFEGIMGAVLIGLGLKLASESK